MEEDGGDGGDSEGGFWWGGWWAAMVKVGGGEGWLIAREFDFFLAWSLLHCSFHLSILSSLLANLPPSHSSFLPCQTLSILYLTETHDFIIPESYVLADVIFLLLFKQFVTCRFHVCAA